MNRGRPIYWHEGVLLRPQHFQQQDIFHDAKLYDLVSSIHPYFWGIKSLSVSEAALKEQNFEMEACEVLFQDGSFVRLRENAQVKGRSLAAEWDSSGKPVSVYLGLRKLAPAGVNVPQFDATTQEPAGGSDGVRTRFVISDPDPPTRDLFAREGEQPILYLEYNVRILLEQEAKEATDHHVIKIAEVQRSGEEAKLVEDYVPPVTRVAASPFLMGLLRNLGAQLTARGHELGLHKRGKEIESADLGAPELLYLLGLTSINRWIPVVRHYIDEAEVGPWAFYSLLRQMTGELSTFSTHYDVFGAPEEAPESEGLPPYRHTNLTTCFSAAVSTISQLLEELTRGPDFVVDLLFDDTYYCADVPERFFHGGNRYYLCARTTMEPEALIHVLQNLGKMSAREYLPILITKALPGVALVPLTSLPAELPRRPNSTYFAIEAHGLAWEAIREGANVAVYCEETFEEIDFDLQFMVVYGD